MTVRDSFYIDERFRLNRLVGNKEIQMKKTTKKKVTKKKTAKTSKKK